MNNKIKKMVKLLALVEMPVKMLKEILLSFSNLLSIGTSINLTNFI